MSILDRPIGVPSFEAVGALGTDVRVLWASFDSSWPAWPT